MSDQRSDEEEGIALGYMEQVAKLYCVLVDNLITGDIDVAIERFRNGLELARCAREIAMREMFKEGGNSP